jgi:hypothetical protein
MQKITVPNLWDTEFLKVRAQVAIESAKHAQSEQDWLSAEILSEQAISNIGDYFRACPLSACHRARRCVGNPPLCMRRLRPKCPVQNLVEQVYVKLQQERRAAVAEHRAPDVLCPAARRVRRKDCRL